MENIMAKENTLMEMENGKAKNMQVHSRMVNTMVKELILGLMEESLSESLFWGDFGMALNMT